MLEFFEPLLFPMINKAKGIGRELSLIERQELNYKTMNLKLSMLKE